MEFEANYTLDMETLTCDGGVPRRIIRTSVPILALLLNIGVIMLFFLSAQIQLTMENISIAILTSLIFFTLALFGGEIWQRVGYRIATAAYMVFIDKDKSRFQKFFAWLYRKFAEDDKEIYIEGRAKDSRVSTVPKLVKHVSRLSITQMSFYVIIVSFITKPILAPLIELIPEGLLPFTRPQTVSLAVDLTAIALAVVFMLLYLPMSFLLEDANFRTWDREEITHSYPSVKIRSRIDSFIGYGAILTGWTLYNELQLTRFFLLEPFRGALILYGFDIIQFIDYGIWLIYHVILSWPLILPASYYYFPKHHKVVNKLRAEASDSGIPVAVTMVRKTTPSENELVTQYRINVLGDNNNGNKNH